MTDRNEAVAHHAGCRQCQCPEAAALRPEKEEAGLRGALGEIADYADAKLENDEAGGNATRSYIGYIAGVARRALGAEPAHPTAEGRCTCGEARFVAGGHLADCPQYHGLLRPEKEEAGLRSEAQEFADRAALLVRGGPDEATVPLALTSIALSLATLARKEADR